MIDWGRPFRAMVEYGKTFVDVANKFEDVRAKTKEVQDNIGTIKNETIKMIEKVAEHHSDIGHLKIGASTIPQQIETRTYTLKAEADAAVTNRVAELKGEVYATLNTRILELERRAEERERERSNHYRELEARLQTQFSEREKALEVRFAEQLAALDAYKFSLAQATIHQLRQEILHQLSAGEVSAASPNDDEE